PILLSLVIRRPPSSTPFPYTTLFRSLHRFGARLQDVELAVLAVLAPFDVHRAAIVLLDDHRVTRQLEHVLVGQGEAVALLVGDRSEEHTSELQSRENLVCRLLLEKKN